MIQLTPQMRILVAVEAQDFRKGIDGLARICREVLDTDPFGGTLFVFRNRRGTALKCLVYDSQGFGWRRNACRAGVFAGGRPAGLAPRRWKPTSCSD